AAGAAGASSSRQQVSHHDHPRSLAMSAAASPSSQLSHDQDHPRSLAMSAAASSCKTDQSLDKRLERLDIEHGVNPDVGASQVTRDLLSTVSVTRPDWEEQPDNYIYPNYEELLSFAVEYAKEYWWRMKAHRNPAAEGAVGLRSPLVVYIVVKRLVNKAWGPHFARRRCTRAARMNC
ncbi:unnamed protein product, partial [Amoebophrya sp. A120]